MDLARNFRPCPYCSSPTGYRHLTSREELARVPANFARTAVTGAYNLVRNPRLFVSALTTPTAEFKCRNCEQIVRICPNCDKPYRSATAAMLTCTECENGFM